jgi:hypothetical protein
MATIFSGYRPRIALRMAAGNKEIKRWLDGARFAKTRNGYFVAWHENHPEQAAVLPPNHPEGEECLRIESWNDDDDIETAFEYIESGRFEEDDFSVMNLFIIEVRDKDGNRIPELEDKDIPEAFSISRENRTVVGLIDLLIFSGNRIRAIIFQKYQCFIEGRAPLERVYINQLNPPPVFDKRHERMDEPARRHGAANGRR